MADFIILESILAFTLFFDANHTFQHFQWQTLVLGACVFMPLFHISGFYTFGRFYRSRFKALVVFQAVTVGYLIFSTILLFCPDWFFLQRTSIILAYLTTLFILLAARLWSLLWRWLITQETPQKHTVNDPVRHVLVIGGAGYIGSALLGKLLQKGYKVRLLDLLLFGEDPIQEYLGHPNLEILRGDFRQVDWVVRAIRGVDAVIHLGGIVGDPACAVDEELTIEVNLTATRTIAEVAKGFGIERFIFVSSCSVYGAGDHVLNERSALNPVSLYAKSKIASELILRELSDARFSPTILRFATIFGLSGRTRFDLVVNLLTAKALTEGKITVFGEDQWRPFLHVDDAAEAVLMTLEAPIETVARQVFNVGDDKANMTLQQAGALIQSLVPTAELLLLPADGDRRSYRVDFSHIKKVLKFQAKWDLSSGIKQVIKAFEEGRVKDYKDPKYSNVMFFKTTTNVLPRTHSTWAEDLLEATTQPGIGANLLIQEPTDD